ncbi:hypothetical protein GGI20_004866 [Coemansia sp. BCRC 34301]|nr:hypothetical protein GGI20_004866 [Coemansia sp. BCRC 34301]
MQLVTIIPALAAVFSLVGGMCSPGGCRAPPLSKRQMPPNGGMGSRYNSPFAAFWNQGIVPGQGFPQVGMSAYGYGLPGLGLSQFLNPDAVILEGAGKGEINGHDLDNIDRLNYGFDRLKADANNNGSGPDPTYPGRFKSEDYNDNSNDDDAEEPHRHNHYHHHGFDNSSVVHATSSALQLLSLIALILQLV